MQQTFNQLNPWWFNGHIETGVSRLRYLAILKENKDNREIVMLLGSRRVGKTTIMRQWIDYLLKNGVRPKNIFYALLDHPDFTRVTLADLVDEYYKIHSFNHNEKTFIFLDEIQYHQHWDQELKALYETRNIKFFLSGSAVSLISRQKNFLTGRYLKYAVSPLDYQEFLSFAPGSSLDDYLTVGGYPEFVLFHNPQYLLDLVDSIVYKDIVEIHKIRNPQLIKDLLLILARNVGFKISLNKIAKTLRVSIETVKDYLHHLEEVFLVYETAKFSDSLNEVIYNEKKYYFYDTGLASMLSGQRNLGSLAENAVANRLRLGGNELRYFYQDKMECDFVVKKIGGKGLVEHEPVEVKYGHLGLSAPDFDWWQQKGLRGFCRALDEFHPKSAHLITKDESGNFLVGSTAVAAEPLVDFLS